MKLFFGKDPVQAELEKIEKQEEKYLEKNRERRELPLNRLLQDKIPDKLQGTLEAAFAKAFSLIFEKGTGVIEKTYRKEELEKKTLIRQYAADVRGDRKSLKAFSQTGGGERRGQYADFRSGRHRDGTSGHRHPRYPASDRNDAEEHL